jgi:hypothetical protein
MVGTGLLRIEGDADAHLMAIERLRRAREIVDHVVVLHASDLVREHVVVWPPLGDTASALRSIKRAFDPAGILNAGRGFV